MTNNLRKLEKDLKSFAKRAKDFKYTESSLIIFLMTGGISLAKTVEKFSSNKENLKIKTEQDFDVNVSNFVNSDNEVGKIETATSNTSSGTIDSQRQSINNSISSMKTDFRRAKKDNDKLLRDYNLELIQLMEQGDQVVKSPWSSWQYGMNYYYADFAGIHKGAGDKEEKYPYEGIFTRYGSSALSSSQNRILRYIDPKDLQHYDLSVIALGSGSNLASSLVNSSTGYGLASNDPVPITGAQVEVNANITPRTIAKASPQSAPAGPNLTTPEFEPITVNPPTEPVAPTIPNITPPSFNLAGQSSGNSGTVNADLSTRNNGAIEAVVLASGNFNAIRNNSSQLEYYYSSYSGISPWSNSVGNDSGNSFTSGGETINGTSYTSWSNWSRGSDTSRTTTTSSRGLLKLVGDYGYATILANSNNLLTYTSGSGNIVREFIHMDHHNDTAISNARNGLSVGVQTSNWNSSVSSGSSGTTILNAFDDVVANVNSTNAQKDGNGNGVIASDPVYTFITSGRIVMEGSYNVVTNNYDHDDKGNSGTTAHSKSISINTGDIVFQPYYDGTNYVEGNNAVFSSSNSDGRSPGSPNRDTNGHLLIMYNGNTGKVNVWTPSSAVFLSNTYAGKPTAVVNRGTINVYGEKSSVIFSNNPTRWNIQFTDYAHRTGLSASAIVAGTGYAPVNIYGDSSIGLFWEHTTASTQNYVEGNFAVNIGTTGLGNQNFTTGANTGTTPTGQDETNGTSISNYDINSSDSATANAPKDYIRNSFGIFAKGVAVNLNSHLINIADKTENNIGVMVYDGGTINLGGGNINITGGFNNIGLVSENANSHNGGTIVSTGDVNLNNGGDTAKPGNIGIYAEGSTANITVEDVKSTNTKNSTAIFAANGATVTLTGGTSGSATGSGLIVTGATVDGASTTNGINAGAVYATGTNTIVNINRIALPTTTNIDITGATMTDNAAKYAGYGLLASNNGKINAQYNDIKVTNGAVGLAVLRGTGGVAGNTQIDFTNSKLEFDGNGYAIYNEKIGTGYGVVDISDTEITLKGKSVGFIYDLSASNQPVIHNGTGSSGTNLKLESDDSIALMVQGITAGSTWNRSNFDSNFSGIGGTSFVSYGSYNGKLAAINDLDNLKIDTELDKLNHTDTDKVSLGRTVIQRARVEVDADVTAHLDATQAKAYGENSIVGYAMNSATNATTQNQTAIIVNAGKTVSADNTGSGAGAVGLFINSGVVENSGTINVEKSGGTVNNGGAGIYAVGGSKVENNAGSINVSGEDAIGILGMSWRKNSSGQLVVDEFASGTPALPQAWAGEVDVTNKAAINLDGERAVGIYVEDNSTGAVKVVNATNDNGGVITMTGKAGVGMAGKEADSVVNAAGATINAMVDNGVGMYAESSIIATNLSNAGDINVGTSSSDSTLRAGMFTASDLVNISNSGNITGGDKSYGIYTKTNSGGGNITVSGGKIEMGNEGVAIYSTGGNVTFSGGTIKVGDNDAVGVFIEQATGGQTLQVGSIGAKAGDMIIGNSSYGYVAKDTSGQIMNLHNANVQLGDNAVFAYTNDSTSIMTSSSDLVSTGNTTYGLYSSGFIHNSGNINFETGIGNVGIYATYGGTANNSGHIIVGKTDTVSNRYGIGMAAGYNGNNGGSPFTGNINNTGTITVKGQNSIGMYGTESGTVVTNGVAGAGPNSGIIELAEDGARGMYLDRGAVGYNYGTIKTVAKADGTMPSAVMGVVIKDGATIYNYGIIDINSASGVGIYKDSAEPSATGTINVSGGATDVDSYVPMPTDVGSAGPSRTSLDVPVSGPVSLVVNGVKQNIEPVHITTPQGETDMLYMNGIGIYIDTLGKTNPISGLGTLGLDTVNLIIGAEAAQATTAKYIHVSDEIMKPYLDSIAGVRNFRVKSGALHWVASTQNNNQDVYLAKIPYTDWAGKQATPVNVSDTYNFLDGLEQRYGVEALGSRENQLFQKLNGIGANEAVLFYQAVDEMMGHQYANVQQRMYETGNTLDREFDYLRREWATASKDSNKIKVFGQRGEYKTDTAGVIDYKNNAYGVAYVHENETYKLGQSSGWYAGAVTNRFKLKDIGGSKETQNMIKAGIFKTMTPGINNHNGALQWTIQGDVFGGINEMKRRFLVVDEIFGAKSNYNTYGVSVGTEIAYTIRTSERTSFRPYAGIKAEYGRFTDIKEKSGEIRLEVDGNDYFSVKPEVGVQFKYSQPLAVRTNLTFGLSAAYENEIGKVKDVDNKTKVRYTDADWFGIRSEKDSHDGNGKFDINLGIENTRFGVTANFGYDTDGENIRGGIGFRAIY